MSLNLADLFVHLVSIALGIAKNMGVSTEHNAVQWIASQPLFLPLNNQLYQLASCPVDNFMQYIEKPDPGLMHCHMHAI